MVYAILGVIGQRMGDRLASTEFVSRARDSLGKLFDTTCYDTACGMMFLTYHTVGEGDLNRASYYLQLVQKQVELLGPQAMNLYRRCLFMQLIFCDEEDKQRYLLKIQKLPAPDEESGKFQKAVALFKKVIDNLFSPKLPSFFKLIAHPNSKDRNPACALEHQTNKTNNPPINMESPAVAMQHLKMIDETDLYVRDLQNERIKTFGSVMLAGLRVYILQRAGLKTMALEWADKVVQIYKSEVESNPLSLPPTAAMLVNFATEVHFEHYSITKRVDSSVFRYLQDDYVILRQFADRFNLVRPTFEKVKATFKADTNLNIFIEEFEKSVPPLIPYVQNGMDKLFDANCSQLCLTAASSSSSSAMPAASTTTPSETYSAISCGIANSTYSAPISADNPISSQSSSSHNNNNSNILPFAHNSMLSNNNYNSNMSIPNEIISELFSTDVDILALLDTGINYSVAQSPMSASNHSFSTYPSSPSLINTDSNQAMLPSSQPKSPSGSVQTPGQLSFI